MVGSSPDLNHHEVFIRNNVPVMAFLLLHGRSDIVRRFLDSCLTCPSWNPCIELAIEVATAGEKMVKPGLEEGDGLDFAPGQFAGWP